MGNNCPSSATSFLLNMWINWDSHSPKEKSTSYHHNSRVRQWQRGGRQSPPTWCSGTWTEAGLCQGWCLESLGWEYNEEGSLYLPSTSTHKVLHEQPKVARAPVELPQCAAVAQGRETRPLETPQGRCVCCESGSNTLIFRHSFVYWLPFTTCLPMRLLTSDSDPLTSSCKSPHSRLLAWIMF